MIGYFFGMLSEGALEGAPGEGSARLHPQSSPAFFALFW
jgi:hypothetical protein